MGVVKKSRVIAEGSDEVGMRMDRIVQSLCGGSRAEVAGLIDAGCVEVNAAVCIFPGYRVEAGEKVFVQFDPARRYHVAPRPRWHPGCDIVFEDAHLLVVLKPAAWLTVPTRRGETNTLVDRLSTYVRRAGADGPVHHAQRLDRGVSGLLLFGKSPAVAQSLRDQFAQHKPEREYVALVAGGLDSDSGTFDSLLATDRDLNRFSTDDESIGQRAITHYRVHRRLHDATLVRVWLETGRRNQIRVHFAEAGHPVLGDPRYAPDLARHRRWPYDRLALHARLLGFRHPATGRHWRFVAPLPAEMEQFLATEPSSE